MYWIHLSMTYWEELLKQSAQTLTGEWIPNCGKAWIMHEPVQTYTIQIANKESIYAKPPRGKGTNNTIWKEECSWHNVLPQHRQWCCKTKIEKIVQSRDKKLETESKIIVIAVAQFEQFCTRRRKVLKLHLQTSQRAASWKRGGPADIFMISDPLDGWISDC